MNEHLYVDNYLFRGFAHAADPCFPVGYFLILFGTWNHFWKALRR